MTTKFPDTVDLELKNVHETTKKFSIFDFILVIVCDQKTFFKILVKVREKGYESKKICKMCGLIRKITMKTKKKGRIQ